MTYYAIEQHPIGITLHSFDSRADRDQFVAANRLAARCTAKTAMEPARGVHQRREHHILRRPTGEQP